MYEVGTYNSEPVEWWQGGCKAKRLRAARWRCAAAMAMAARGKVAAAAKPFFERQRNESRVGGGPHGDLL